MLKRVACYTCQHEVCHGCDGCTMYSATLVPNRAYGGYCRCLCLTAHSDEVCPHYKISEYIKNTYNASEEHGPIDACPVCGSLDTEWVIDDDYNYNKCHDCGWSSESDCADECDGRCLSCDNMGTPDCPDRR